MVVEVAPLILWRGWGLAESVYSPPPPSLWSVRLSSPMENTMEVVVAKPDNVCQEKKESGDGVGGALISVD